MACRLIKYAKLAGCIKENELAICAAKVLHYGRLICAILENARGRFHRLQNQPVEMVCIRIARVNFCNPDYAIVNKTDLIIDQKRMQVVVGEMAVSTYAKM